MQDDEPDNSRFGAMDLAACTCANLRKATRVITQAYDAALQPTGLKATQFTLLSVLENCGPLPLTQFAAALVMDRTTLTRNLKPLAAKEFVAIEPTADQRVRQVVLTLAGMRVWKAARPHWERAQSRLVERMGVERWSGFTGDLWAVTALVRKP
jgi:DNA-binding MarR family transcriptional regulator